MGCSCSKATSSVVSGEKENKKLSGVRESYDISNSGFMGMDKDNTYEV